MYANDWRTTQVIGRQRAEQIRAAVSVSRMGGRTWWRRQRTVLAPQHEPVVQYLPEPSPMPVRRRTA